MTGAFDFSCLLLYNETGDKMNIIQWLKLKRKYNKQIKKLPDKSFEKLIEKTIRLFPEIIDISDGCLEGKKSFFSKRLSDAWHNAEVLSDSESEDVNFMIWAIYCELHKRSIENFKNGIMSVSLSELSDDKISRRYIKNWLEADMY